MKKKLVLLAFVSVLLSTTLSLCVVGLLELRIAHASPYTSIGVATAYNMITNGSYPDLVVLDVRTKSEYDGGHIYGAVWIPVSQLATRIGELVDHENHEIIVYCASGGRSVTASGILDSSGFTKVYNMLGGISAWQSAGYPVYIATVHNVNTTFNYDTIQAAINVPQTLDGHTILVDAGIYYEHIIVNKAVSLIGEDRSKTIIDGNGTGTVVRSIASDVEIEEFTVQNGGDVPNSGIIIGSCINNAIRDSVIRNNAYGIELLKSNGSSIFENTIMNNSWAGIYIHDSNENTIHGNTITNNSIGTWIASSTVPNTFYHNKFINNTEQVDSYNSTNVWDNGCEGNYWSNYNGSDLDLPPDGIGDEYLPWEGVDYYPLMSPYMVGDLNSDGRVSITDIVIIALAFGSEPGDPNWNPNADINNDGKVTITDVVIAALHFGETW